MRLRSDSYAIRDRGEGRIDCAGALIERVLLRGDPVRESVVIGQGFTTLAPNLANLVPREDC